MIDEAGGNTARDDNKRLMRSPGEPLTVRHTLRDRCDKSLFKHRYSDQIWLFNRKTDKADIDVALLKRFDLVWRGHIAHGHLYRWKVLAKSRQNIRQASGERGDAEAYA